MEGKKGRKDRFAYTGRQAGALVGIQQLGGPQPQLSAASLPPSEPGSVCLHCTSWGQREYRKQHGRKHGRIGVEREKGGEKQRESKYICYLFLFVPFDDRLNEGV